MSFVPYPDDDGVGRPTPGVGRSRRARAELSALGAVVALAEAAPSRAERVALALLAYELRDQGLDANVIGGGVTEGRFDRYEALVQRARTAALGQRRSGSDDAGPGDLVAVVDLHQASDEVLEAVLDRLDTIGCALDWVRGWAVLTVAAAPAPRWTEAPSVVATTSQPDDGCRLMVSGAICAQLAAGADPAGAITGGVQARAAVAADYPVLGWDGP